MKDSVKDAVERILDSYLEMNNHRKTPERYAILRAVYDTDGHFTLDELGEKLAKEYKFPVSRATLYNTIELMIDAGIVRRLKLDGNHASYEKVVSNIRIRLMCDECGKVKETRDPNFIAFINTRKFTAFNATGFDLYVTGTCSTCARKLKRMKRLKRDNK